MASSSSPPLLNLTDITFDSVTCDSYEAPFSDKSRSNSSRMLISPLSKMSDGLLKQKRSRNSNLGRAKSFLSIFHRNRENGAFPTADNGKRGTKQVSITPFIIPPSPHFHDTPNGECSSQQDTDGSFFELANEHSPQDLFCGYDDECENKENNRPPKEKEGTTSQVSMFSPAIELSNTMETQLDLSDEMDCTLEGDASPVQNRGIVDQTDSPTIHADLNLHAEPVNFTSDFHELTSFDPFVQIIRDNDQAPAILTGSPPREETNLCKSLQSEFHQVIRQEAENFSFDWSKRVLFKETSNEVRFFSRSDSELELFRKKHRVSVRQKESKYSISVAMVDVKPENEPAVPDEASADFYNFFSKNWKTLEESAVTMKGNLSSWTSTLNMPDLLCNSHSEEEPPLQAIPLRNSNSPHPVTTQNSAEAFKGVERSLPESAPSHNNQQKPIGMSTLATSHAHNIDRTSQNLSLEASESTEIMLREVKGQNFVAFGENENAIPFKKDSSFVPIDRKKSVVNGARRWSRSQQIPSPQQLSVEQVNEEQPVSQCIDHPLLLALKEVNYDDEETAFDSTTVMRSSPVQLRSRHPPTLENSE